MTGTALLCDIGGTNARFAYLDGERLGAVTQLETAAFPTIEAAIRHVLAEFRLEPQQAVLSVAGPVARNCARLTNAAWSIDGGALRLTFDLTRALVVNDFLALAYSLPELTADERAAIGPAREDEEPSRLAPMVVIGPGTGFGAALYLPTAEGAGRAVPTEAGHATLAAGNELEAQVIALLHRNLGHAAVEDAVSGPGLARLDQALATLAGEMRPARSAAEIVAQAGAGEEQANETLTLFFGLLGATAGNIAVTTGARGGVYLAGGIPPRLKTQLERSSFRMRFEAKGRMTPYLKAIPTWLITAPHPAFKGLARLATTPGRPSDFS